VSGSESSDGILEQFLGAGQREGLVPSEGIRRGGIPRGVAGDAETAQADDRVARIEGPIAFIEEGLMAGGGVRGSR
jgi:hypothetical protein